MPSYRHGLTSHSTSCLGGTSMLDVHDDPQLGLVRLLRDPHRAVRNGLDLGAHGMLGRVEDLAVPAQGDLPRLPVQGQDLAALAHKVVRREPEEELVQQLVEEVLEVRASHLELHGLLRVLLDRAQVQRVVEHGGHHVLERGLEVGPPGMDLHVRAVVQVLVELPAGPVPALERRHRAGLGQAPLHPGGGLGLHALWQRLLRPRRSALAVPAVALRRGCTPAVPPAALGQRTPLHVRGCLTRGLHGRQLPALAPRPAPALAPFSPPAPGTLLGAQRVASRSTCAAPHFHRVQWGQNAQ
mmetsp:Transcript_7642/g.25885  ORF Transcript_7642/g.25885 Transcript_7642/m.25885 type:complete len:298 (+) Transcript_7642:72-965(+)